MRGKSILRHARAARPCSRLPAPLAAARRGARPPQAATGGASARSPPTEAARPAPDIAFSRLAHAPAPPGTGPASTATRPPAARRCGRTRSASPTGTFPAAPTVKFVYHGRQIVTQVIDRGPYAKGNAWDLTNGAAEALGFEGVGPDPLRGRAQLRPPTARPRKPRVYGRSDG